MKKVLLVTMQNRKILNKRTYTNRGFLFIYHSRWI